MNDRHIKIWFFLVLIVAGMGWSACGGRGSTLDRSVENTGIVPMLSLTPTYTMPVTKTASTVETLPVTHTPLPTFIHTSTPTPKRIENPQNTPFFGKVSAVGWYGYVVNLPIGSQFDDYLVVDDLGEFGLEGTTEEIQALITALRDQEYPDRYANFWGVLDCSVSDYNGCQLQVSRIRSGKQISQAEPFEGWQGTIISEEAASPFDDSFILDGDFPVRYGIRSANDAYGRPTLKDELSLLRDKGRSIKIWGEMTCGVKDVNACQLWVSHMLEESPSESPYEGWIKYSNAIYGFTFHYSPTWSLEIIPEQEWDIMIANFIKLERGIYTFFIGYHSTGQARIFWTGMPAGEIMRPGFINFFGERMEKWLLVYEGKVKVLASPATTVGELVFAIRLDDNSGDYSAIDIPEELQDEAEQILGTFEFLK